MEVLPPIRTVHADPDPIESRRMRAWLRRQPDIDLVGSMSDGASIIRLIRRTAPELAVINVHLPDMDAFGVLAALGEAKPRATVLVSSQPPMAARALQERVTDFLLQPISHGRFEKTLDRVRSQLRSRVEQRPANTTLAEPPARITLRTGKPWVVVNLNEIVWVRARGIRTEFRLTDRSLIALAPLKNVERRLTEAGFVRINRSLIVSPEQIAETRPKSHGDHWLTLHSGERFVLSRTRRLRVLRRLGCRVSQ